MSNEDDLRDLKDPELKYVLISPQHLMLAVKQVETCMRCNADAEIPFDWVIRVAAGETSYANYILPIPGACPSCKSEIHEKTLVQPIGNPDATNWI